MAWHNVVVQSGKDEVEAMRRGNEVQLANSIGEPKTIKVDGASHKVDYSVIDERDDVITFVLAGAGNKKEKSDDKPDEGADKDNSGG